MSYFSIKIPDGRRNIKPFFIRKLPARVEMLEGQSLELLCQTGCRGCKPWFVKKLPSRVEVAEDGSLEMTCVLGVATSEQLSMVQSQGSIEQAEIKPRKGTKIKMEMDKYWYTLVGLGLESADRYDGG